MKTPKLQYGFFTTRVKKVHPYWRNVCHKMLNFRNSPQHRQFCTSCEAPHHLQCWSLSDYGTSLQSEEGKFVWSNWCHFRWEDVSQKMCKCCLHIQISLTTTLIFIIPHKTPSRPSPRSGWNLRDVCLGLLAGWRCSSSELDFCLVVAWHLRHQHRCKLMIREALL